MFSLVAAPSYRRITRKCTGSVFTLQCNRTFAVKELSWCSLADSRKNRSKPTRTPKEPINDSLIPIERFGIVAAMSKNRLIGVDGQLPWTIPKDRELFVQVTTGKILILGRNTFEEAKDGSHISHTRCCILVSHSANPKDYDQNKVRVARDFPSALHLAKQLVEEGCALAHEGQNGNDHCRLECWVGGGERLYEEALRHKSAHELHLTVVDTEILPEESSSVIAMFPAKYRWDVKFEERARRVFPEENGTNTTPAFTHFIYRRRHTN